MIEKTAAAAAEVAIEHSLNFFQAAASEKKRHEQAKETTQRRYRCYSSLKIILKTLLVDQEIKKGK